MSTQNSIDQSTATTTNGRARRHSPNDGLNVLNAKNADAGGATCSCREPVHWTGQAGQDQYVWQRVLKPQKLCCRGVFVEFGARNGVTESNTRALEKYQGWTGLLAEVDPRESKSLRQNRGNAQVIDGPFCPRSQTNVTIVMSSLGGWTGTDTSYGKAA